ncbi:uncharacterized protein LOC142518561 isoform X1 [Primulina tabacum]|uniref:uncharacterized protein LOC142518561 isoform X1 n=1 Tax=Primulina tabacum TaxID=48773 RepID=UPI003F59358B
MAGISPESKSEERDEESNEITLRPIALSDIDDFMVWATDDRVSNFCTWDAYTSKHQAFQFINDVAIPHPWFRVICINNRAVGSISVTPNSEGCRAELGYVLAFEHWGKEIVTRAVKMVASNIFKEWPELKRLQALVNVENKGSQRVLEKAGFLREGVLRKYLTTKGRCSDMVIFSFLCTDLVS